MRLCRFAEAYGVLRSQPGTRCTFAGGLPLDEKQEAAVRSRTPPDSMREPVIVRIAGLIAACGVTLTLIIGAVGLPGSVHGLIWRTTTNAADSDVTLKVAAGVGALFVGILALG